MQISGVLTIVIYLILIVLWSSIFVIYLVHLRQRDKLDSSMVILLIILSIDAFRTLFESVYFGMSVSSQQGLLPTGISPVLGQFTLIPKSINVFAGTLILFMLIKNWLPKEIQAKHEAQLSLKESEQKFRTVFEKSPLGVALATPEPKILEANPALLAMLGYSSEELLNKGWQPITHPDDVEKNLHLIEAAIAGKRNQYHMEKRYIKKNGDIMWANLTVSVVHSQEEQIFIAMVEDITERKHTEEELRKLKRAVEQSPVAVVITDQKANIEYVSPAFTEICGFDGDEAIGKNLNILRSGYHDETFYHELWQVIQAGQVWEGEFCNKRKNGELYWESSSIAPVFDDQHRITNFVTIKQDITEKKEAEKALLEAKQEAERANQAKSIFLANMSHEIRTPMNSILGFAEILKNQLKNPVYKKHTAAIHSSGKTLLKLINDILDFSKIEAGKLDLEYSPVKSSELLEEMKSMFEQKMEEKKIEFLVDFSPELPTMILIDEFRVRQILLNLLSNAFKFTDKGWVKLTAQCQYHESDKHYVNLQFSIEDTGIGISLDQQSQIFGVFEQQKGQSHDKYGGTGLGLAITKQLVEMMNGKITVESKEGRGSKFTVIFKDVHLVAFSETSPSMPVVNFDEIQFQPATILIVEDIELNRELIKGYLYYSFLTIIEAENGLQGIELAKQHHPDLILMDMKMPVMNGYETSRRLKADAVLKNIPIVAITASALKHDEERILQLCNGYLRKPISKHALMQELMNFLKHSFDAPATPVQQNIPADPDFEKESHEQQGPLTDLLQTLENTTMEVWKNLEIGAMSEVQAFGQQVEALGKAYNYQPLLKWSTQLKAQIEIFDLAGYEGTLQKMPKLIEDLKERI